MEHKTFSVEIKALDYTGRTVEGYAAAFGNIDGVGDIIHRRAFKQTLTDHGHKIKFLWQHDPSEPIGKILSIQEDDQGLAFKAAISDTTRGRDALALLKDGAIGEMSIGYDVVKGGSDYSKAAGGETVRNLRALKLWEISLVTFPANEQAVVTGVKQQDTTPVEVEIDTDVDPVIDTPEPETKAGRVLSSANVNRIMAAMSALHEALSAAGVMMDGDGMPEKSIHDIIEPLAETAPSAPANADTQPHNSTTPGPDTTKTAKPASVLLREIDINLAELDTLEV